MCLDNAEHEHQDENSEDELERVHWAWSLRWDPCLVAQSLDLRSGLGAAVGNDLLDARAAGPRIAPYAGHIARFLGREVLWASICFSLILNHILNGTIPIAARGIRTQIQLAIRIHVSKVPFPPSRSRMSCTATLAFKPRRSQQARLPCRETATAAPRKRLDLRSRLSPAVGDDLLEHPYPRARTHGRARSILGGLFGRKGGLNLELLLAEA